MQGPLCTLSSHLLSSPRPGGGCPPRSPTPEGGTSSEGLSLSRLSSVPPSAGPWALWGDGRGLGRVAVSVGGAEAAWPGSPRAGHADPCAFTRPGSQDTGRCRQKGRPQQGK